ncbi:MAG: hypothetical protein IT379_39870 [Deltaproteobacteria bacterium]|nr:hypothetical protein [Deltaproteobacteria bacterium]
MQGLLAGVTVAVLTTALVSCGDDRPPSAPPRDASTLYDGAAADGGSDADTDASGIVVYEPIAPAPPEIPWLDAAEPPIAPPSLGPCPDGWREIAVDGEAARCDPWPASGPDPACGAGEAHLPGTPGCAPIGRVCSADGWPADLPADRPIVHVDDDAPEGGDGATRETAYRSIRSALARAPGNAVIAVAVGRYDEPFELGATRALWGACTAGTVLTASRTGGVVVLLTGDDVELRDVTIDAPARSGIALVDASASGRLRGVIVQGAGPAGIAVDAGRLDAMDVVVRGTRVVDAESVAFQARRGAEVTIERVLLSEQPHGALVHGAGTRLVARSVAIVGHSPGAERGIPSLVAFDGARVELERAVIDRADRALDVDVATLVARDLVVRQATLAISATGGSTLDLARVHVAETTAGAVLIVGADTATTTVQLADAVLTDFAQRPRADLDVATAGIGVFEAAELTLARVELRRSGESVLVAAAGAAVSAEDVRVSDSPGVPMRRATVHLQDARLALARAHLARTGSIAIAADGSGARLDASDVAMIDLPYEAEVASGLVVVGGAQAVARRWLVERASASGLEVTDGATLELTDAVVRDVSLLADDSRGWGIRSVHATLLLSRGLVERTHEVGVVVSGGSATLADLAVREVAPDASYPFWGMGIGIQDRATATLSRVEIADTTVVGLDVMWGSTVDVSEIAIRRTVAACADCEVSIGGFGLLSAAAGEEGQVAPGATLRVQGLLVEDSDVCSVVVGDELSSLDLERGTLRRSPTGACVQADRYDLGRLMNDISFLDIRRPVEATRYEIPTRLADLPPE